MTGSSRRSEAPPFTRAWLRWGRWPFRMLKLVTEQHQVSLSLHVEALGVWEKIGRVTGRQFADFARLRKLRQAFGQAEPPVLAK